MTKASSHPSSIILLIILLLSSDIDCYQIAMLYQFII